MPGADRAAAGVGQVTGDYEVFRQLVLARIIEPASQQDSLRVLEEIGRRRTYIRPPLVGL
jgi:hypothetical protein